MSASTTPTAVPLWEDLLEIFYGPTAVFERRKNAGFFIPLLVLAVAIIGLFYAGRAATMPIIDAEYDRGMVLAAKQNPAITPEAIDKGRGMVHAFAGVGVAGFVVLGPMIAGLILWVIGKFFGARQELGAACLVTTYAFYPRILDSLLGWIQTLVLPSEKLTSHFALQLGPARLFDPDSTSMVLMTVLGRLDVVTIWCTVLVAIGMAVTGKLEKSNAAMAAGSLWLLGTLFQLIGPLRQAAQ